MYRAQANKQGLRITRNNNSDRLSYIKRVAQTGRKTTKTPRRVSKREGNKLVDRGADKTNLITLLDVCVSSQHSPNTVTRLSHNSTSHGVVGVNMVVIGCSSQHVDAVSVPSSCNSQISDASSSGRSPQNTADTDASLSDLASSDACLSRSSSVGQEMMGSVSSDLPPIFQLQPMFPVWEA